MLQCQFCSKPFTNPSSHARHLRYCLKARNRPRVRQKSCQACSASKVKCTFQRPSCARCHKKGTSCVYDDEPRPSVGQAKTPSMTNVEPAHLDFQPWGEETSQANEFIDWNAIDLFLPDDFSTPTIIDLNDFPGQPELVTPSTDPTLNNLDAVQPESLVLSEPLQRQRQGLESTTTASSVTPPTMITQASTPLTISPSMPVLHTTILKLHQNLHTANRTITAAKYSLISIIRGLRSYPLMMTQKETFPPLIHSHFLNMSSPNSSGCPLPGEIISKCMSLSHLYALRTPETSPYLWNAIIEQSNIFMTHLVSSSGQTTCLPSSASLIAAIQAQLIYVIMRIVDGSSSPSSPDPGLRNKELNMNYSIMYAFKKLCETFVDRFGSQEMYFESYASRHLPMPLHRSSTTDIREAVPNLEATETWSDMQKRQEWENWIVSESWRRMKVIYFLIDKIVDVNMGASVKCTSRYADVDWIMLPCSRTLWEARSETEWESSLNNFTATRERLDTIGALLRAHQGAMIGGLGIYQENFEMGTTGCAELLDRWHVEADGLGALLNASLGMM